MLLQSQTPGGLLSAKSKTAYIFCHKFYIPISSYHNSNLYYNPFPVIVRSNVMTSICHIPNPNINLLNRSISPSPFILSIIYSNVVRIYNTKDDTEFALANLWGAKNKYTIVYLFLYII